MTAAVAHVEESPRPHKFTREEYYQMADAGLFQNQRVELIDGEIIDMAAQRDLHVASVLLTQRALAAAFPTCLVRTQAPLNLGRASDPEPDVSVVSGSIRDYVGTGHPRTALLVVEVADTTLRYDQTKKAALYASAELPEYWIVNLVDRRLEVLREPESANGSLRGAGYRRSFSFEAHEFAEPLGAPGVRIAVADLLP